MNFFSEENLQKYPEIEMNPKILNTTAKDLSKFCDVDMNLKFKSVSGSIEEMLARLEEFQTMLYFVTQDRIDYNDILTSIPNYGVEFDQICNKIDTLESLISHIQSNLDQLEHEIEKVETELGCTETSAIKVTNIFTPLFKKTTEKKVDTQLDLFKSEDYFV